MPYWLHSTRQAASQASKRANSNNCRQHHHQHPTKPKVFGQFLLSNERGNTFTVQAKQWTLAVHFYWLAGCQWARKVTNPFCFIFIWEMKHLEIRPVQAKGNTCHWQHSIIVAVVDCMHTTPAKFKAKAKINFLSCLLGLRCLGVELLHGSRANVCNLIRRVWPREKEGVDGTKGLWWDISPERTHVTHWQN